MLILSVLGTVIIIVIGLIAVAVAVLVSRGRDEASPVERLLAHVQAHRDYRIEVGVPLQAPVEWAPATVSGDALLTIDGLGCVPVSHVTAFFVTYSNGQLLDSHPRGLALPEWITGLSPASRANYDVLHCGDFEPGTRWVRVAYGPSPARPRDRSYYATSLRNISDQPVRVLRFAGYRRTKRGWELSTVTGDFYSNAEFRAWYGLADSPWILPGQSATDLNNYGGRPVLWAYYCVAASGREFITGATLE